MKKLTILFALLFASVMGWATQYCGTAVQSTVDNTGVSINVTVKKSGDNTVLVQFESAQIASMRAGGTFQQWGNGVWSNQDDAVANFATGWSQEGNVWSKEFTFSTYPTSGSGQIYALFNLTEGTPAVAGFTLTDVDFSATCTGGSTPDPTPVPATYTINSTWPTERVTASKSGDDFLVNIASYGGAQWQAQLKLAHNISFASTKAYKLAFTITADKNCGGITLKTDDNQGSVWEDQSINLTANTPFNYEKVFAGQSGNNKITVFDFGWVGENTNITISDLTLVEYSPATASSINGDNIPFKAVDGNTGTRWQAASTGEQWWKMDYGTAQSFNRVNITWEYSYAKSFTIQGSNDDETYTTLKTITGQTLAEPNNYKQVIDLDQTYSYRHVKFVGTENANGYGFSFYEFEILEVESSVLTDVVITSPKRKTVCAVGQSIDITAMARDQYEEPMAGQTITYSLDAPAKGSIDENGHYTASAVGEVTITATCSDKTASIVVVNTVSGNLALNKPATAGANEAPVANANDANLVSLWSLGPNKAVDQMWWQVDLEETYDLSLVIIKWEGACPTEHAIQVSANGSDWTDAATKSGWPEIGTAEDHNYQFYTINATGRYIRVKASALRENGWGMKIFDFQAFGTVAASPTKSVSASANNPAMGTATVKQNNVDVTSVETGSTVTFSAVANEGYIFVDWSNGNTNASFEAEVNANMNLTANFRALGNVYCMNEMEVDGHTIYVTMKRTATNTYRLIVRSNEELQGFGNAFFYRPNNIQVGNIKEMGVLSDNNHTLTATLSAETVPYMTTPLYVEIRGVGERTFPQLTNIEYGVDCDDNVSVSSVSLPATAAVAVGASTSLTATVAPAFATNTAVTWSSDNTAVATVSDEGVVTGVATGTAHITATTVDGGRTAQCTVTVLESQIYWGNGRDANRNVSIAYSIEYNSDKTLTFTVEAAHDKVGFVVQVTVNGAVEYATATSLGDNRFTYTTAATYEVNDVVTGFFYTPYQNSAARVDFSYTVGSTSENRTYAPVVFDQDATDASWIAANNGKTRDVTVARTLTANTYFKTICFPFSMTAAQIDATFGDCEILLLTDGRMKTDNDIYLQYVPVREIVAGKPYLMTVENTVTGLDFNGVTINSSTDNNQITVTLGGGRQIKMLGTFTKQSITASDLYYLDVDGFLHSVSAYGDENNGAAVTIPAFRCYYQFVGFGSSMAPVRVRVVKATDVETGFEQTVSETTVTKQLRDGQLFIIRDGKCYTVTGMIVK